MFPINLKQLLPCLFFALCGAAQAAEPVLSLPLKDWSGLAPVKREGALERLKGWCGLQQTDAVMGRALVLPGKATFRFPDGPKGSYKHGFRVLNDSTSDWSGYQDLRIGMELTDDREVEVMITLKTPGEQISAKTLVQGKGDHDLVLPRSAFAYEQARYAPFRNIKEVEIEAKAVAGKNPEKTILIVKDVAALASSDIALDAEIRGMSVEAGGKVVYPVRVANCSRMPQAVALGFITYGWEAMQPTVEPSSFSLNPGENREVKVTVVVPERIPPGGHEKQTLRVIGNGNGVATLDLISTSKVSSPFILHTPSRWQEVRDKVMHYDWAKTAQEEYVSQAEKWQVPEIAKPPGNDPDDTYGPFLFKTQNELGFMACGISWQLTGRKEFAEKVRTFLLHLSDPQEGYSKTLRGCNQALVQEGHFFQHIAMAYDMTLDSGIYTETDREQIAKALRIFIESMELVSQTAPINNWNLSEMTGALYCSLVLGDFALADRFFSGPAGIKDLLAKGTMDDGWWYECAVSYNVWCTTEFTQVALALQPFGINFRDEWVPASYASQVMLTPPGGAIQLNGGVVPTAGDPKDLRRPFGMENELWGGLHRPYRQIRDLWNSLLPFVDYRGVMFGINDSTERRVGGAAFDIAYFVYRDPAYAAMVQLGQTRDLLYGVPELPKTNLVIGKDSATADNVGLVLLRSQKKDRPLREQISAALHYGSHGWAHGHFDRTNLLSLTRYGRSFYNPEMIWFGYEPFMYKFYVQTSESHNMVVVDQKMQEASPGQRLLFHSGDAMQATVVETTTRWSYPPYGGMVYDYVPVKSFEEKTWREGRFVPIPEKTPAYGSLTGYTEPIRQRRLMVVTDDFVLIADDLKAEKEHTFESLFQMKGFLGLEAKEKSFLRHDDQWSSDPLGSAQFVTDVNWYSVTTPAVARFRMLFGPGADNEGTRAMESEDGPLNIDYHSLWPEHQEIMIGTAPEEHDTQKRLFYRVLGDGKLLKEGKFGSWILGRDQIDVPVEGIQELVLETRTELSKKPTIFWGDASIVTRDGKEIPLSSLPQKREALVAAPAPGKDYFGGPIKLAGKPFESGLAAEPLKNDKPGEIAVDLSGLNAVRFHAEIGGDYPLGDEAQRRKTLVVRAPKAAQARFIALLEPHEGTPQVRSAVATGADSVRVELADGRVQEISFKGLDAAPSDLSIQLIETKDGKILREETAVSATQK